MGAMLGCSAGTGPTWSIASSSGTPEKGHGVVGEGQTRATKMCRGLEHLPVRIG